MSTSPPSVRMARYDARRDVTAALDSLFAPLQAPLGAFGEALAGREGLTPEQQAAQLSAASTALGELSEALDTLDVDSTVAQLAMLQARVDAAVEFATGRDFDAHMAAKAAAGDGALASLTGDGFVTPDEAVGDFLAASLTDDLDS